MVAITSLIASCRALDLRHENANAEKRFKASRTGVLGLHLTATCVFTIIFFSGIEAPMLLEQMQRLDNPFHPLSMTRLETRSIYFWIEAIAIGLIPLLLLLFLICWRYDSSYFKRCDLELLACVGVSIGAVALPFGGRWRNELDANDAHVVLLLACVLMISTEFIPIRVILKWIPVFLGVVSYIISSFVLTTPHTFTPANFLMLLLLTLGPFAGSWKQERCDREVRGLRKLNEALQMQLSRQHESLMSILDRLCDGTVKLGSKMDIVDPSPRLSALLMQANHNNLQGVPFLDFIPNEEERKQFQHALKVEALFPRRGAKATLSMMESMATDSMKGMCHIHLRDSFGYEFLVSAYYSGYTGLNGEPSYVVGLIENQEREKMPGKLTDDIMNLVSPQTSVHSNHSSISISVEAHFVGTMFRVSLPDFEVLDCNHNEGGVYHLEDTAGSDFSKLFNDQTKLRSWIDDSLERFDTASNGFYVDEYGPASFMVTIFYARKKRKVIIDAMFDVVIQVLQDTPDDSRDNEDDIRSTRRIYEASFQVSRVMYVQMERMQLSQNLGTGPNSQWGDLALARQGIVKYQL
eukprot:TRINITY_DN24293_c0_g3_i1.p1 TRINITY_DN24293_c0_g3~~TRINITY_DN24293_c0_g3_i1.p1  ORF type:complete len:579 (+),score=71.14 TRINITY_DN24293_c0_g3_i1:80-1816(+)